MRKNFGAALLGAAVIAAGAMAPGSASAQQTWTYGYDRGAMDQPGGRDWGQGRNYQRDRDTFNRGYQMGREEERRAGQQRGYYGRDYGYGPRTPRYGTPYAGGERFERFDREPDFSGYNQYNRGYTGYGYGGGYAERERDDGWFDGGWFD
ncbi:hypothetical protein [Falsiroseomonas sp.]|uniref:hypothetical protein n=1 Tax=Falsiroseomonas sp. TaxID=2870721 RepID=UPI0035625DF1